MDRLSPLFVDSSHVLLRPLLEGPWAELHEAEHLTAGERRILLLVPGEAVDGDAALGDWQAAARVAASLRHEGFAELRNAARSDDGGLYASYSATSLRPITSQLVEHGPYSVEEASDLGVLLLGALAAAHRSEVVHGALSPETVWVSPPGSTKPQVLVLGLGFARVPWIPGSEFQAAEQAEGDPPTPASDVYSAAALVHLLLTGQAPQRSQPERSATIPAALYDTLASALREEPTRRHASARALAAELAATGSGRCSLIQATEHAASVEQPPRDALWPHRGSDPACCDERAPDAAGSLLAGAGVPRPPTLPRLRGPGGSRSRASGAPAAHNPGALSESTWVPRFDEHGLWVRSMVLAAASATAGLFLAWVTGII